MSVFPVFNENHLEQIARILGEEVTGTQLTNIFNTCGISDISGESTKWRRIYHSLLTRQRQDRCGNNVATFIKAVLSPGRFISINERFENVRRELNAVLSFDGLELNQEAVFRQVTTAKTITEAEKRTKILSAKLSGRKIHPEVVKFCKTELLQNNYFHAVFEATKGLAQRIRDLTGLQSDGSLLVDEAFSLKKPLIAFNSLQTETEISEHKGFAMLLKGCFAAVRNPLAHEPKILWTGENDAADYLTIISLLHRKLDEAIRVPYSC
jgi:uncharacterized protein (TIGR02391 family)